MEEERVLAEQRLPQPDRFDVTKIRTEAVATGGRCSPNVSNVANVSPEGRKNGIFYSANEGQGQELPS